MSDTRPECESGTAGCEGKGEKHACYVVPYRRAVGPGAQAHEPHAPFHEARPAIVNTHDWTKDEARVDVVHNPAPDMVNMPPHYAALTKNPDAVIDLAEVLSFNLGNVVKYCARSGKKEGEDALLPLKKAKWYLEREIARLEKAK